MLKTPGLGPWDSPGKNMSYLNGKGEAAHTGPVVKGEYGNKFGAVAEEGEQNKLDNCPS